MTLDPGCLSPVIGSVPEILQESPIAVVEHSLCSTYEWWGSMALKTMICAGGDGRISGCQVLPGERGGRGLGRGRGDLGLNVNMKDSQSVLFIKCPKAQQKLTRNIGNNLQLITSID